MITFEEFKAEVEEAIHNRPASWRKGQAAFNYIDLHYRVARMVQFMDHIDCFYNDDAIDSFVEASYKRILMGDKGKSNVA